MESNVPDDPTSWDEDRVVLEVCTKPDSLFAKVPNRNRLEQTLRDNNIDGECLLELDLVILKDDLGIASLGQRLAIFRAIKTLRNGSAPPLLTDEKVARVQDPPTPQTTTASLRAHSPGYFQIDAKATGEHVVASRPSLSQNQHGTSSTSVQSDHQQDEAAVTQGSNSLSIQAAYSLLPSAGPANANHPATSALPPAQVSLPALSSLHEDQSLRSISELPRKGSLKQSESSNLPDFTEKEPISSSPHALLSSTRADKQAKVDCHTPRRKRRIAPTVVHSIESRKPDYLSAHNVDAYYGSEPMAIQDVFYRVDATDHERNFQLLPEKLAPGFQKAISHMMRHYLRQLALPLPNTHLMYRMPYEAEKCAGPNSRHLFSLFLTGGDIRVEPVDKWLAQLSTQSSENAIPKLLEDELFKTASQRPLSSGHLGALSRPSTAHEEAIPGLKDFQYLLEKYKQSSEDEDILPLYGESGDENDFDDETWQEIEAERAERAQAATFMSRQDIASVIDDTIRSFEGIWQEKKLPRAQAKAYLIWYKTMKLKIRQPQIDATTRNLRHFEARLTSLKDAVLDELWQKATDIKLQCQSMEETVFSILECRHILRALEKSVPPEKPSKAAFTRKPKEKVPLPEGEEILESEDDMADFLSDESSSAEDIPFAQESDLDSNFANARPRDSPAQSITILDPVPSEKPRTPPRYKIVEAPGDEADIETDEDEHVTSSLDKKRRYPKSLTPRKKPTKAEIDVIEAIASSSSDSDSSNLEVRNKPKASQSWYSFPGQSESQTIDLTMSDPPEPPAEASSSEFDVRTPPLNPVDMHQPNAPEPVSQPQNGGKPSDGRSENAREPKTPDRQAFANTEAQPRLEDVPGIRKLPWEKVTAKSDRIRALYKAVYEIDGHDFRNLSSYLESMSTSLQAKEGVLKEDLLSLKDGQKNWKADSKAAAPKTLLAMLFVTYVCSKPIIKKGAWSPSDLDMSFERVTEASKKFFGYLSLAVKAYITFLENPTYALKRKAGSLSGEDFIIEDESSDVPQTDEESRLSQSVKRRKRAVAESQEAKAHQKTDQQRVKEQELRRKAMEEKFAAISSNENAHHLINTVEPFVPLDPHIAARAKPHQIAGIRFMWREIVDDPKHQGCLLAHTMGLGKTMQVISLLVTIAQCNQHDNPRIRDHIPQHLQQSQTIILCPPTLLDNWYDEILMWLPVSSPNILGALYKIRTSDDIRLIEAWASGGGVIIMSYDLFRSMLTPKKNKQMPGSDGDGDEDLAHRQKLLLDKASLVVADEAHKMKNANSGISRVTRAIKTHSRIALTGSPLNNHLEEYHTMVDWIFPGYLGDMVQFRAKYVEPIHMGLYAESTAYQRRTCLKKLHVLKQDLAPKVNRADITAISKDLPPKTEYVITLPLTDHQRQSYDIYARHMLQTYNAAGNVSKHGLFSLISILTSLCNHPWIFLKRFKERSNQQNGQKRVQESGKEAGQSSGLDESDVANSPYADADAEAPPLPEIDAATPTDADISAMEEAVAVFREFEELGRLQDPALSYRALVVQQILEKSMGRGDKVLVFSHSLDTLNYLEVLLKQLGCMYLRIDGQTPMKKRQDMVKQFNNGGNSHPVCLISTKAGGLGLNFQGANRVIIYDFGFNPVWEEQAVGRAYRLGQKQPVHVYRFKIGGTVEEVVINKAIFKTQLFSRVVDKKNPTRQASNRASDYLFLAREVEQQEFTDCVGKDPGVLDAIIENCDKIRNIELTETFHREDNEQLNAQELKEAEEEYDRQRLARDDPEAYRKKYGHQVDAAGILAGIPGPSAYSSASYQPSRVGSRAVGGARPQPPAQPVGTNNRTPKGAFTSVGLSQAQNGKAVPGLRNSVLERANRVGYPMPPARTPNTPSLSADVDHTTARNNLKVHGEASNTNGIGAFKTPANASSAPTKPNKTPASDATAASISSVAAPDMGVERDTGSKSDTLRPAACQNQ